jgi:hypothetical protein
VAGDIADILALLDSPDRSSRGLGHAQYSYPCEAGMVIGSGRRFVGLLALGGDAQRAQQAGVPAGLRW